MSFKCYNDKTKLFKGTEPSPLGGGFSATAEKLYTVQYGKDGNKWRVMMDKSGQHIWKKFVPKFQQFKYKRKNNTVIYVQGLESATPGYIHKFVDMNTFRKKKTKIQDHWVKMKPRVRLDAKFFRQVVYNPKSPSVRIRMVGPTVKRGSRITFIVLNGDGKIPF